MNNVSKRLMASTVNRYLLALIGVFILIGHNESFAQEKLPFNTPMKYAMQLPLYCHGQYFKRTGPQYRMPGREQCGIRTNHFCPGLGSLFEARDTQDKTKKMNRYRHAKKRFLYTKRGIAEYPQCPLHSVVDAAIAQVQAEMRAFQLQLR